uniref:NADH-ubiquinone oxidoreductase chain 2 n=1 Tax=Herpele squalostoma TaxID=118254 RepID=K7N8N6_HERSQ|nr:NADH dehydrogenase subunit 2 [Herpele squalostoma]ADR03270.1 NADH dehydrogenase subunit 2 [Herpele squalostoma]
MSPYALSIMISGLAIGTMLTVSSSHWLLAWVGLEINTLAIIPLMTNKHHPRATEATTKYFLTQATASALILFTSMGNAWITGQWDIKDLHPTMSNMMTIALMMKLGLAPMHFWLPEVMQGLNLTTGFILATWQKIAPMTLMYMIHTTLNPTLLIMIGILSALTGGWGGLNQTELRKIMAYSSIAHLGWMVVILPFSPKLAMLNFTLYLIMTSAMFLTIIFLQTTKLSSMSLTWPKSPLLAALSIMTLLSLAGLPPTTGFMPKWLILQELTKQHTTIIATVMAFSALLSLFFYLRLSYMLSLTQAPNTVNSLPTWYHSQKQPTWLLASLTVTASMLLPLTPNIMSW